MSVVKALKDYIQQYKELEIVQYDRVDEDINSYAIYPTGNSKTKTDVMGNKTYQRSFMFLAKKATSEDFEREENYNFLEGFCDWVEDNIDNEIYPVLGENMRVDDMEVSNIMLMDVDEYSKGIYQVQINLIYTKEV